MAAVVHSGGDALMAAPGADDLERRYAQPHRRYHTSVHVEAVVRDGRWLAAEVQLAPADRALLTLAACAHDVVYDARPGEDEHASAAWAREQLVAAGVDEAIVRRVEQLVLNTLTHEGEAGDTVSDVLLDADLAILGADPAGYDSYVRGVRAEFAAVPGELWRVGRAQVLARLLDRDPLFRTAPARQRWEAAARANIGRELLTLR